MNIHLTDAVQPNICISTILHIGIFHPSACYVTSSSRACYRLQRTTRCTLKLIVPPLCNIKFKNHQKINKYLDVSLSSGSGRPRTIVALYYYNILAGQGDQILNYHVNTSHPSAQCITLML